MVGEQRRALGLLTEQSLRDIAVQDPPPAF
jgi:hypothetical protein